ncbi:cyclohexanecarboxylate-CoA ligase [Clostridium autoethanogenum]|uniref:Cyclohexanecarboxylate-CoA ligase n=1 Tax=Clostridium autoethanogenum TaxID=84023 RepID=A0A3M0T321_9CLOT|nr:medium-chain fatty-acid--CoA ligase [Clostridium autoethanogenum]RMD04441.1 cyclohexanecarboxylate-CoA ligase [Clostridium autoethanogenum]
MDEIKINDSQKKLYEKMGYWGKKTLLDYWHTSVKKYRDKEFVVDDRGYRYTYGQLDEKAGIVASYFLSIGVKPLDVISFQIPIWSEFVIVSIACMKVGAVVNPIGMCYSGREVSYLLNLCKSKVFLCPTWYNKTNYEKLILSVKKDVKSLKHIVLLDNLKEKESNSITLKHILSSYFSLNIKDEVMVDSNDVAAILCTSGTTGCAKGAMLTHNNIIFSEKYFNKELGITKDDIMFMPAPLNHATGFHHGIIAPMLIGSKVVLQQKFKSKKAIELMNREKCTWSMGATPFIYDILKNIREDEVYLSSLKFYLCGGAVVPEEMVRQAYEYGIKLCEVYGSTESVPHVFVRPDENIELTFGTAGRAMEGVEVKIVDENRKEILPGNLGEEVSRGPNVFVGYIGDKSATNKVLDDEGWFYSGDLCVSDISGNINIIGRKKDIIVRGGENLNSNHISQYISKFPLIKDEAVIGMPDKRLGERICAYVVLKKEVNSLKLEELLEYMEKEKIPKRYWPEHLEIIDKIPRTDSGKVKKNLLAKDLKVRMSRQEESSWKGENSVQEDQEKQQNQGLCAPS